MENRQKLPGRELDALVAEKVMGWKYSKSSFEQYDPSGWWKDGKVVWTGDFCPSTDISAAWEALEKLKADWSIRLEWMPRLKSWHCTLINVAFDGPDLTVMECAPTLPYAICLAILAAIGT